MSGRGRESQAQAPYDGVETLPFDPDGPATRRPRSGRGRSRRHRGRVVVGTVLLVVGLAALVLVVWGGLSLLSLERHARAAASDTRQVRAALSGGDARGALTGTRAAATQAAAADHAASAVPLRLATHLPGPLGSSVGAVRALTGATHLALTSGAVPLLSVAAKVEDGHDLLRADGSIDVDRLKADSTQVDPAAAALERARRQADSVAVTALPAPLRPSVRTAKTGIDELADKAGPAAAALAVLPSALGADGPRSYLVIFQNTAELRPTGGIAGSWALVSVNDGRAQLQQTGSDDDLASLKGPVRDLGKQFATNYPQDKVALAQDVNLSPNFPYAGQLYSDLWAAQGRQAPDGVIAVDPNGMAPLLAGAGTLQVAGGPAVNSGNVVDVLLRQVYVDFATNNAARKKYVSDVVGEAFSKALGGGALNATTVRGLVTAVSAHHVLAWSSHAAEQRDLVRAGIAGELPRPSQDSAGVYLTNTSGVYLTNIAASKLDYYLHEDVTTTGGCSGDLASMNVVLRNDSPAEVPDYVANKVPGLPRTTESLYVAVYVPPRRGVSSVIVDGSRVPFAAGSERGWSLVRFGVQIPRNSAANIVISFAGATTPVTAVMTQPLVNAATVVTAHACGS